jgi:hypothetical protein
VETHKRDGDKSKVLDGEDGKCAGYAAEVGERERRAEEGISTGGLASISYRYCNISGGYVHSTRLQPQIQLD